MEIQNGYEWSSQFFVGSLFVLLLICFVILIDTLLDGKIYQLAHALCDKLMPIQDVQ